MRSSKYKYASFLLFVPNSSFYPQTFFLSIRDPKNLPLAQQKPVHSLVAIKHPQVSIYHPQQHLNDPMATKKVLVVFGATGVQGGSVAKAILGDAKLRETWTVRGVTRDVSKPSAKVLETLGAETVAVSQSSKSFRVASY
jgi:hypothetical protein